MIQMRICNHKVRRRQPCFAAKKAKGAKAVLAEREAVPQDGADSESLADVTFGLQPIQLEEAKALSEETGISEMVARKAIAEIQRQFRQGRVSETNLDPREMVMQEMQRLHEELNIYGKGIDHHVGMLTKKDAERNIH